MAVAEAPMMDGQVPIPNPDVARALDAACEALRKADNDYALLLTVTNGVESLASLGDDGTATDLLRERAIKNHGMAPSDVQMAFDQGIERATMARSTRRISSGGHRYPFTRRDAIDYANDAANDAPAIKKLFHHEPSDDEPAADTSARRSPKPKSRDINDVKAERNIGGVREMFDGTRPGAASEWPALDMRLLDDDRVPPPPFDWKGMPPAWVDWVEDTARDCGAPADYIAATLISVASAVIGNARRVSPWGGWVEQAHLWFALIGQPSTNKTVALAPYKTACNAIEKDAERIHNEALKRYAEKKEAAAAARRQWQDAVKKSVKDSENPPSIPKDAQEPDEPIPPRVMIADASTEEVGKLLAGNPNGLVLVRSELSAWLGQFDRYGGAGTDRGFYLEAWDGGSHVIDRVKFAGVPLRVPYASLAIVGSLQPDHLRKVFAGINDGLAARFIYVWPSPVPPRRPDRSGAEGRIKTLRDAFAKLRRLDWGRDENGDPVPMILRLDEPALKILDKIRDEAFEANQMRGEGMVTGWRGKNPGRLLRLALVFELLQWAVVSDTEPMSISAEMTARAADFLDYAAGMMSHVFQDLLVTDTERDVASLARFIMANPITVLNEREIYQREGFHRLRDPQHRKSVFSKLVEAGWIRRAAVRAGGRAGGRPPGDWDVNPEVRER
jgi:hypothetical protein